MRDHPVVEALERDGYPEAPEHEYFVIFDGHGWATTEDIENFERELRSALDKLIPDCEVRIATMSEVD